MKGFLFSAEALLSLSVIILALLIVQYEPTQISTNENAIIFQNQNTQLTTLYFNLPERTSDINSTNEYCAKIARYSPITKAYYDTNVCRGIR